MVIVGYLVQWIFSLKEVRVVTDILKEIKYHSVQIFESNCFRFNLTTKILTWVLLGNHT